MDHCDAGGPEEAEGGTDHNVTPRLLGTLSPHGPESSHRSTRRAPKPSQARTRMTATLFRGQIRVPSSTNAAGLAELGEVLADCGPNIPKLDQQLSESGRILATGPDRDILAESFVLAKFGQQVAQVDPNTNRALRRTRAVAPLHERRSLGDGPPTGGAVASMRGAQHGNQPSEGDRRHIARSQDLLRADRVRQHVAAVDAERGGVFRRAQHRMFSPCREATSAKHNQNWTSLGRRSASELRGDQALDNLRLPLLPVPSSASPKPAPQTATDPCSLCGSLHGGGIGRICTNVAFEGKTLEQRIKSF